MKTLALLLNALLPGLGHILIDRHLAGFVQAVGYLIFADGMLIGWRIWEGPGAELIFWYSFAGAALIWVYSMTDLTRQAWFLDRDKLAEERKGHFLAGMRFYYRGDYHDARDEFREVLALGEDSVGARLMIAFSFREEHQFGKAKKVVKECQLFDRRKQWSAEIDQALQSLEEIKKLRRERTRKIK